MTFIFNPPKQYQVPRIQYPAYSISASKIPRSSSSHARLLPESVRNPDRGMLYLNNVQIVSRDQTQLLTNAEEFFQNRRKKHS